MPRKNRSGSADLIFFGLLALAVVYFAILAAPHMKGGLAGLMTALSDMDYTDITWCEDTLKCILIFLGIYAGCILVYISSRKNIRADGAYGSASWGNISRIAKKYVNKEDFTQNKILSENIQINLNTKKHRRNKNTMVDGGSGAGKSRFIAKPNLYQANTSFIVLDTKGELLRDSGNLLKNKGYKIKVVDMINMENSDGYNPFHYIHSDLDIQLVASNFFRATTPKESNTMDHFWDDMAQVLLKAVMSYLWHEAPSYEQNFPMICELVNEAGAKEDDENYESPLDILFRELEERSPDHIAVKYYKQLKKGAGKTIKSVVVTLNARLDKFNIAEFAAITKNDELDLEKLGEEKTALFLIIPSDDTSFNFWVSLIYLQTFQTLMRLADRKYNGSLPVEVHFLMDEFANVQVPEDFDRLVSLVRSYNISLTIFIQAVSQLKKMFKEDQYKVLMASCDEFVYLGGNEDESFKYVSERLGKETIDVKSSSRSRGRNGSYSVTEQQTGRELLTQSEVSEIDDDYCIIFIRGQKPVFDRKYDIMKHPNIALSRDGGAPGYNHSNRGISRDMITRISVIPEEMIDDEADVVWLSDDEVRKELNGYGSGSFYADDLRIRTAYDNFKNNNERRTITWLKSKERKLKEQQTKQRLANRRVGLKTSHK